MLAFHLDDSGFEHDTGPGHPERPARLRAVQAGLEMAGLEGEVVRLGTREATRAELEAVHSPAYVEAVERFTGAGGGPLDADTVVSPASWRAALRAAGAGLEAVDAVERGEAGPVFLALRPPGHHALPDRAMGFCLFNNVAVTAAALVGRGRRVAVFDWDAHHGNGTQDMFWAEPDVFYVSFHQSPLYPGTGALEELGAGAAEGTTMNVPVPPGATGDVYRQAWETVAAPALDRFAPDWVLVSCGYDAHRDDPLTMLGLSAGDYADLARLVLEVAPDPRRVVSFLEGGYDLDAIAASTAATLTALHPDRDALRPEAPTSGGPGHQVVDRARSLWALD